ncbi:MAG TPA: dipeptidase [Planctomycetota bacterium]|nr:dipeptidase [Planctomycetota bacterium]
MSEPSRALALLERVPLVDGHNDLPWQLELRAERDLERMDLSAPQTGLHTDIPRLQRGGIGAQFWAAYVPCEVSGDAAVKHALLQVDLIHRFIERWSDCFAFADSADDVEAIHSVKQPKRKVACLIGVEGGHALGSSLAVLRILRRLGTRYLTLTHNKTHDWADSATDVARHGGLSAFGEEVVREANRVGILVDLSHTSVATMEAALRVSRAPVVFTHSSARALCDHVRNVPDAVLRQLRENGGTIMVTFVPSFLNEAVRQHWARRREVAASSEDARVALESYDTEHPLPRATLVDVALHLEHLRAVVGVDHIGIGGDFDGIESVPLGLEDVSKYVDLFALLFDRGWTDEELAKVAGHNILRTLRDAEQVARKLS